MSHNQNTKRLPEQPSSLISEFFSILCHKTNYGRSSIVSIPNSLHSQISSMATQELSTSNGTTARGSPPKWKGSIKVAPLLHHHCNFPPRNHPPPQQEPPPASRVTSTRRKLPQCGDSGIKHLLVTSTTTPLLTHWKTSSASSKNSTASYNHWV